MAAAARIDYAALRPLLGDAEKGLVMIGRAARAEGLDPALLELVDLRASQLNGCAYCVQTHTNKARKAGIEWARITQLATWPESPLFSDRERTALALTEALTRIDPAHGVPDALHDRAAQEFGPQALAALTAKILGINAWNRRMIAYRITPPASEE
jgi:AhpD family alkylhydroperoxidase